MTIRSHMPESTLIYRFYFPIDWDIRPHDHEIDCEIMNFFTRSRVVMDSSFYMFYLGERDLRSIPNSSRRTKISNLYLNLCWNFCKSLL